MAFRLRGKSGAALTAALLGFVAWQGLTAFTDLDAGVEQELTRRLGAEYVREQLRDVDGRGDLSRAAVDSLLAAHDVTVESLSAVGDLDETVVRVEILVNGRPPADGAVRYYRMSYRLPRGWSIRSETSAITYYSAFF